MLLGASFGLLSALGSMLYVAIDSNYVLWMSAPKLTVVFTGAGALVGALVGSTSREWRRIIPAAGTGTVVPRCFTHQIAYHGCSLSHSTVTGNLKRGKGNGK